MKVIFIMSGKGGVGKTTIAVNMAYALKGYKTGILDADIHGPNIPNIFGFSGNIQMEEGRMIPLEHDGIKVMSVGFMLGKDDSVIWRGPMKHKLLKQFAEETEWGELDYLVVDLPPGTGDEALSVVDILKNNKSGAIIVSTPQKVSIQDSLRCIDFCKKTSVDIIGIIENMSGGIFGEDTLKEVADSTNNEFLGKLSLDESIVKTSEEGETFVGDGTNADKELQAIAEKVKDYFG